MTLSRTTGPRLVGELTYSEINAAMNARSVLCLPLGSMEQHGPHLPLNTDSIVADGLARRIAARWATTHDTWLLPLLPIGLSPEHAWAPGTMSLSLTSMADYLRNWGREIARALPARNLLLVNGHGGNRGILDAVMHELRDDFGLNACTLHLGALMSPACDSGMPEVHGGNDETSVMLALAPELVRHERIALLRQPPDAQAVRDRILDPGVAWPWSSGDKSIADQGITGDPAAASAAHGLAIVERIVEGADATLRQLVAIGDATGLGGT